MDSKKNKINRLMKKAAEGRISSAEEAELQRLLAGDEKARQEADRLSELEKQLHAISGKNEPVDVTEPVMREIQSGSKQKGREKGSLNILSGSASVGLKYAAAGLIGLALGAALTWVIFTQQTTISTSQLKGTMMERPAEGMSYVSGKTHLRLIPYVKEDICYLNFFIDAPQELIFDISFDREAYRLPDTESRISGDAHLVDLMQGQVRISATERTSFQVVLEKTAEDRSPVLVKVLKNNVVITSQKLFQ